MGSRKRIISIAVSLLFTLSTISIGQAGLSTVSAATAADSLIMGTQVATAEQMAAYALSKNSSPKISCTMLELATMFLEEGAIEGVRGDIAFAQACKETGYFAYGGKALPEWNNYCGLGVTGVTYDPETAIETKFTTGVTVIKDPSGNSVGVKFSEPRLGVRAQIQHLKGYATSASLKQTVVDPRYAYISKGIAPNWSDLNGRWAVPGVNYGQEILALYDNIMKVSVPTTMVNLAKGSFSKSSSTFISSSCIADGDKNTSLYASSGSGLKWVQLDLGGQYNISDIKLWHYYGDARKYRDVVVQLSNDPAFASDVVTVFNNDTDNSSGLGTGSDSEYSESSAGKDIPFNSVNMRYVRLYSSGSSVNGYNHYVEVEVYGTQAQASKLSVGKAITSSATFLTLSRTNDGDKSTSSYSSANSGLKWVQIDLGAKYSLSDIKLWHYYGDSRKYHDVVVQVSNDPTFSAGVVTVFNNDSNNSAGRGTGSDSEYAETSAGKDISFNPINARYVRVYSNGSSVNGYNHYVEVEVYGN